MKLLICGDRHWTQEAPIRKVLERYEPTAVTVIHGDAPGADRIAGRIANEMGFSVDPFPAEWEKYGRPAGPIRNRQMLKEGPDLVVAFHSDIESSKGTKDMLEISNKAGVATELHEGNTRRSK